MITIYVDGSKFKLKDFLRKIIVWFKQTKAKFYMRKQGLRFY